MFRFWARPLFLRWTVAVLILAACLAISFGVLRLRSASPTVEKNSLQVVTVESGPMVCHVDGLGNLVPEDERWLTAGTEGRVDQVLLRPGARVRPDTVILHLSNPDLDRQITDAELAMKKSEAELANLRVQLQAQLLNEKALEAQLEADATQAKLEAERDDSLYKNQLGTLMNSKISRAKADSLATRLQIEREKLGIAEEARQAQLTAKQAEVAQMQALYSLRTQQKEALVVRAGLDGVVEEVSVGNGQQVGPGTILARVANSSRLMARIHVPEAQASSIEINQPATVTLQDRSYPARVVRMDPNVQNGTVSIDLKIVGSQPREARSDLSASGSIEVERIPVTTFVKYPLQAKGGAPVSLYRISGDGKQAQRVQVLLGRVSNDRAQIAQGLQPGDSVIVSDMSAWHRYNQLELK
ncbi:MAG TPA: HlyD family efflux transporter periplasmic adaptor subunit [Methylomirabilota bacterium]|nr:HlyD family efflux transporter periplasmic adaptor subunit [Methylomirabilota bacterium]